MLGFLKHALHLRDQHIFICGLLEIKLFFSRSALTAIFLKMLILFEKLEHNSLVYYTPNKDNITLHETD